MIHAETDSCIAALDLDATSAVESKLFLAENLPSLPRDNVHYGIGNGEILDSARSCARVAVGTRISPRPPPRSRRALLTHRAPPSGFGVKTVAGQRV